VVTQNHFIFQETLRGNLLIAQPDASDEQILQALERAQLKDFVARLPQGLETVMDPRGIGASTGERQRLCIARLLLRESPIMILDEPWSNLDDRARKLLAEVINACKSTATILILTHERHPALAVDQLYHLDGAQGILIQEDPLL
jgi:ABC-type multidrug transport system fused ATPase/permease subunit